MREVADAERIQAFMDALAGEAREDTRVYFTGGATAVLLGWRDSTIDIDLKLVPEHDALLRAIPRLKESLRVNVELASPADFIPVPPGWEDRGRFVRRAARVTYYHFDLHAQALAKVERGHAQDISDVREMMDRGFIDPTRARELFQRIEPQLYRFPAIDPATFRRAVEATFGAGE